MGLAENRGVPVPLNPLTDVGRGDVPLIPRAGRQRVDVLMTYLSDVLGARIAYAGQAPGASHEGWIFRVGGDGRKIVVRVEPDEGPFLDYDGAKEASLLRVLAERKFPVPEVLALGDRDLIGSRFMVLEWISGKVLNPRAAAKSTPEVRRGRAEAMAEMLARLHAVPLQSVRGPDLPFGEGDVNVAGFLEEFGRSLRELRVVDAVVLDFVRVWLERHAPERSLHVALVHGDFRLGNLVWEGGEIRGVLDWETARICDPLFDIAWMCMGATKGSHSIMGLLTRDEFVELYSQASGRQIQTADLIFWQVMAAWVRGCTEARLLDVSLMSHSPAARDARDLSWEFGSARTDEELLLLIDAYEQAV